MRTVPYMLVYTCGCTYARVEDRCQNRASSISQGVPKNLTLTVCLHWTASSSDFPVSASPLTDMYQQLGYDMSRRYQNSVPHNCLASILGAESFIQSMYSFNV